MPLHFMTLAAPVESLVASRSQRGQTLLRARPTAGDGSAKATNEHTAVRETVYRGERALVGAQLWREKGRQGTGQHIMGEGRWDVSVEHTPQPWADLLTCLLACLLT